MVAIPPLRPQDIQGSRQAAKPQEQTVGVHGGLLVKTHDGVDLGRVGEFIIDPEGNLTSFTVRSARAGAETRVWMSWINSVTRDSIVLRLTAAEVHAATATMNTAGTRRRNQTKGR